MSSLKGVFPQIVEGSPDPVVEIFRCCSGQGGLLAKVNGRMSRITVSQEGKDAHFFSDIVSICRGCGRDLTEGLQGRPYKFGQDDGLEEHFRVIARDQAEREEEKQGEEK